MNVNAAPSECHDLSRLEQLLVRYARSFPVRRGKLRVVNALWAVAAQDHGAERVAVLKYGGLRLPCDIGEMLQRQCYFFGTYVMAERALDCWSELAATARTVLDVGANIGIFSLAAQVASPNAVVYAFEPTAELAQGLRRTAHLNNLRRLHVLEGAVWCEAGRVNLRKYRGDDGTNGGMNFVTTGPPEAGCTLVDAISLDDFCRRESLDRVDLLKIDVQGNEHQILAGARELLAAGRIGAVLLELNWAAAAGQPSPAEEAVRLLDAAGYQFAAPAPTLRWRQPGPWMQRLDDVVASRTREYEP